MPYGSGKPENLYCYDIHIGLSYITKYTSARCSFYVHLNLFLWKLIMLAYIQLGS